MSSASFRSSGSLPRTWRGLGGSHPLFTAERLTSRAWRGRLQRGHMLVLPRLTPTYVGRTRVAPRGVTPTTAHPHIRGEDAHRCQP